MLDVSNEDGMVYNFINFKDCSAQRVDGDRFILARYGILSGPNVEDSDNDLGRLMGRIPENMWGEDEEMSVCEVEEWRMSKQDPSDWIPYKLKTLYTINRHSDPLEDS